MKSMIFKIIALIIIFDVLYSCSKGGGGGGTDAVVSLNSFYSLDDLSTASKNLGKVPTYTSSGSENGLISMGDISSCVVMSSGKVKCWGFNANFQLGNTAAGTTNQKTPVIADILQENAVSISAGYLQTCAYLSSGMKCWGAQSKGILGNQVDSLTPAQTPQVVQNLGGQQIKMMAIGDLHMCVLFSSTQSVSCWGQNTQMQLAQPTSTPFSLAAVPINLPEPIKSIATSDYSVCAVAVSGNLYCWGQKISTVANPSPVLIASNVKHISSGEQSHFCYTDTSSNVYCFGTNDKQQLGSSTVSAVFNKTPQQVTGISNATAIVAGKVHTCAITNNGSSVVCWGDNSLGQLGTGSANPAVSATPIAVVGLPAVNVVDIAAADNDTCALLENDDVYCWGNNSPPSAGATSDFLGVANPAVSYTAVKVLNRNDP
ncbi:RCC1 domain-containing protein [Fluviispira vulneris]|uniref:RCC1 domain-containing protein n=1 Tax=Fluviispira vulneris TaxID=2763012 RepID=UPI0016484789|nr:RCC1 domain-containing protein [Fluviispira vulneris]